MKKFTCHEIMNGGGCNGDGCNETFEGETAMDIAKQSSKHFMSSADDAHKPMRDMMDSAPDKDAQNKWWDWFNGEWEKKGEFVA